MKMLDNIIAYFSPAAALRREIARMNLQTVTTRRHDAAQKSRRIPMEFQMGGTPNQHTGAELDVLRNRSVHMIENNGYASNAQDVMANGIVGTGIRLSVRTTDKKLEKRIMQKWEDWANSRKADHYERLNFYAIQQLVIRAVFETGEAIVRRRRLDNGTFQLQVHEGNYLDLSKSGEFASDGSYTQDGIEFSANGKPSAYWLYDNLDNVNLQGAISKRVPIDDVIHVYLMDRAGRMRGLPWLRKSYTKLHDHARYSDAEMQGKIVAACHSAFVSGQSGDVLQLGDESDEYDRAEKLEPGMITYLRNGEQVAFNSPNHHTGYDEFTNAQLREAAAGVGASFEAITGNYSQVNFSSGRMGWIESGRVFAHRRANVLDYFLDRVWEWFMESLQLQGLLKPMSLEQAKSIGCDKTAPRREMLDPVKEANGLRILMENGLLAQQEAIRQLGGDPEDVLAEIEASVAKMGQIKFTPGWLEKSFGKTGENPQNLQ